MALRAGVTEGFRPFMEWLSELRIEELRAGLGPGPETDRLARRVARLSTSNLALELLLGRPTVVVAVRGLAYGDRTANARQLSVADTVRLEREPENPFDANAIRVRLADGAFKATVREIDADVALLRLEMTAQ